MTKEIKCKCKLCRARHRESFVIQFEDKIVCYDCFCEYMKIFRGYKNRQARKNLEIPIIKRIEKDERISEDTQFMETTRMVF